MQDSRQEDGARITAMLADWRAGDAAAERALLDLIYPHLKSIAANRLRAEPSDRSLETTDLVQEAFLKLLGQREANWENRAHFFAIAARLMRRIVVDHSRRRQRIKRGAGAIKVRLDDIPELAADTTTDWIWLHQVLKELGGIDAMAERIVELRFFAGLTETEAAGVLGSTRATVGRKWRFARAWLQKRVAEEQS